jgi:hypothetical protein
MTRTGFFRLVTINRRTVTMAERWQRFIVTDVNPYK